MTRIVVNPGKGKGMARTKTPKKPAAKKPAAKKPGSRPRPRSRQRRKNPMSPAVVSMLGSAAGAAVGGGADIGLRYTSLSPYARGGILVGSGVAAGLALSFVDPTLGAGVGGGLSSVGLSDLVLQATAPSGQDEAAEATAAAEQQQQLAAVRAELAAVRAELAAGPGQYPALSQDSDVTDVVYVDESDLAYV